ncbi:MAG: DUF1887 family CARF protein [Thermodesulfovibrionales bacterium]
MERILVSLVSEQTVPNVLAIRHFGPDRLLFVSTERMQSGGKTTAILNSLKLARLNYEGKYENVVVDPDSVPHIQRVLSSWMEKHEDAHVILNATGGTKIMSLAAYDFFKNRGCEIIYIPIPRNEFLTLSPNRTGQKTELIRERLNVLEYLAAYGIEVVNEKRLGALEGHARKHAESTRWMVEHYDEIRNLLKWFYENLKGKKNEFDLNVRYGTATAAEKDILKKLGFNYEEGYISKRITKKEMRFLTGGWLEEYCYNEIVGQDIDVKIGIEVKGATGRNNEMDVMFTKDNAIYFVECKSLDQKFDDGHNQALYKIGALQRQFGLRVKSFLVSTAPGVMRQDGRIKESIRERGEQFNTRIIIPSEIMTFRKTVLEDIGPKKQ